MRKDFCLLIWGATVWCLWLASNNVVLTGKVVGYNDIVSNIKAVSWGLVLALTFPAACAILAD